MSESEQQNVKILAGRFVDAIDKGQYRTARTYASPSFQPEVSGFASHRTANSLDPLVQSKNWQFMSFEKLGHGKKIVAHCQFIGQDGVHYHTNIIVASSTPPLLIAAILPPSKPRTLIVNGKEEGQPL